MKRALMGAMLVAAGCVSWMVACPAVRAAEPVQATYTLSEVIELALVRHPTMAGAEALLEQSEGHRAAAVAFLNPTITAAAGRGAIRDPSTGVSIVERTFTVLQPLEWPALRSARRRAADAGLSGALAGRDETRVTLVADVKAAFYQVLFAQRDTELAQENLRTVEELVDLVSARVQEQEAPRFELIKATVELQKAKKDAARADSALLVARGKLNMVTGKALGHRFVIEGAFEAVRPELDLVRLTEVAQERHPSLRRHHLAVEQASYTLEQERAARIPTVAVLGQYHREAGDESLIAGLSVPLPIWYRRQGEIGAAMGAHRRAQAEELRMQQELEQSIVQAFQEMRTAQAQTVVFEQGLLYQAKEALDIAQFSFRHGVASLLEVIDAQRVYRQTLLEYAQARAAHSIALAQLERAVGGLP